MKNRTVGLMILGICIGLAIGAVGGIAGTSEVLMKDKNAFKVSTTEEANTLTVSPLQELETEEPTEETEKQVVVRHQVGQALYTESEYNYFEGRYTIYKYEGLEDDEAKKAAITDTQDLVFIRNSSFTQEEIDAMTEEEQQEYFGVRVFDEDQFEIIEH